jgi:hypothetical protein
MNSDFLESKILKFKIAKILKFKILKILKFKILKILKSQNQKNPQNIFKKSSENSAPFLINFQIKNFEFWTKIHLTIKFISFQNLFNLFKWKFHFFFRFLRFSLSVSFFKHLKWQIASNHDNFLCWITIIIFSGIIFVTCSIDKCK